MDKQDQAFQVGDQVAHRTYGPGAVIQLDEKRLSGHTDKYYVVETRELTLWVPCNEAGERCLRYLTPAGDFKDLFLVLSSPGKSLPPERYERKKYLIRRLQEGTLKSICRVIRDLASLKRLKKTNENDNVILNRAISFLLDEWSLVLSVPRSQAEDKLIELLSRETVFAYHPLIFQVGATRSRNGQQ